MRDWTRREMLRTAAVGFAEGGLGLAASPSPGQVPGDGPPKAEGVEVLNPRGRVPVSLIVDDSTCLVNLARFSIPHFRQVFPSQ